MQLLKKLFGLAKTRPVASAIVTLVLGTVGYNAGPVVFDALVVLVQAAAAGV